MRLFRAGGGPGSTGDRSDQGGPDGVAEERKASQRRGVTPDRVAEERKASQRRGVTPDGVAEERKANGRRLARSRVMWGPRQRYESSEHKGDLARA